jgi:hypothetical protein
MPDRIEYVLTTHVSRAAHLCTRCIDAAATFGLPLASLHHTKPDKAGMQVMTAVFEKD